MMRPSAKLIGVFLGCLVVGYGISWWIMDFVLAAEIRHYGYGNIVVVDILIAFLLIIILDSPLKLKTFEYPDEDE